MTDESYAEQYRKANQYRKLAFAERPLIGSPGAPAQAETNVSNIWGHINGGFLFAYEYTRWWKECRALRSAAVLGDWSWLNKTHVHGPNAHRFLDYATVKDISRQQIGQVMHTPMVDDRGKVAIEGLTLRLAEDEFLFTQSAGLRWLEHIREVSGIQAELEDVTPEYTCFALQGPRSLEILEALTGESYADLKFSRWRATRLFDTDVIVSRQGVTGEIGYEFLMRTDAGRAHELWRAVRETGFPFGLRELGFKAQMVGHTETGIATVIRDYIPARMTAADVPRFVRFWMSGEEIAAADWDWAEHFASPAELGWAHAIDLDAGDFHGRDALLREAEAGGPPRRLVGLSWNSDDMAALYAAQFRDEPAAPPPDLPYGQFRIEFHEVMRGGQRVGWASGASYSANMRRMISLARIDRAHAESGTEVTVLWGGFSDEPVFEIRATVAELPFIARRRADDLTTRS